MAGKIYRPEEKHPQPYQDDLNPDASKGFNHGLSGPHPEKNSACTAFDIKELHNRLTDFNDDELKQITVLPAGARLETDATYLDLTDSNPREVHAIGNEDVGPDDYYVPKADVPYELWNRLSGVTDPRRTHRNMPR